MVTGGINALENIQTIVIKGKISSSLVIGSYVGNYDGTLTSFKTSHGQYFQRVELSGLIIIEKATDGQISWERNSYQPYRLLTGNANDDFLLEALIESNDKTLYKRVVFLGDAEVEKYPCYKILFETNTGYQIAKYFDKTSGLQRAQLSVLNDSMDGPTKTWIVFDDYDNSMFFPYTVKLSITTQTPYSIQTSNLNISLDYTLNQPIAKNLFNIPDEINNTK